jgi:hypothetical protein
MDNAPLIDIYDSDLIRAEEVLRVLNEKSGKLKNLEEFRKEIIGRFEEIGLVVDPKVWTTTEEGVFAFDVEITGRCEKHAFDYDRQVHEVTHDILELLPPGERGTIKSGQINPDDMRPHSH